MSIYYWSHHIMWKQLSKHEQNQDPWGNKNKEDINHKENRNKDNYEQGLPDLDDIFHKIGKKIVNLIKVKIEKPGKNLNRLIPPFRKTRKKIISIVFITAIFIWITSGFYTIQEAERGVLTRFGKFNKIVNPGLHWKLTFIDNISVIDVEFVRELTSSSIKFTSDEDIVLVEINAKYRITNPRCYLFSIDDVNNSLHQAFDSALHSVIGRYTMDRIMTEDHVVFQNDIKHELWKIIRLYNMGVTLLDVSLLSIRPPESVKTSFENTNIAREDEQQYIREAEIYVNKIKSSANNQAECLLEKARAYRIQAILDAQGEVAHLTKILPEYKAAPEIAREHFYIKTMEKILSHTRNILVDEKKDKDLLIFSLDKILKDGKRPFVQKEQTVSDGLIHAPFTPVNKSNIKNVLPSRNEEIMEQRRINAQRNDFSRQEKK